MRKVNLTVGKERLGEALTWAYPKGRDLGMFKTPIYGMRVEGTDTAGKAVTERFRVLRFGVHCTDGKTATVVGLADAQVHTVKAWIPTYIVHSASSLENGGWQVYNSFLIHDGPDHELEVFATIGCIEVMGPGGFIKFNDLLIALTGATGTSRDDKLHAIARAGKLSIRYEAAARPPLTRG